MPYKSDAQRRFFHTDTARKKGITASVVKEFDQASKGMKLPEKETPKEDKNENESTEMPKTRYTHAMKGY